MTFISRGAHKKGEGDDDEDVGEGREEEIAACAWCATRVQPSSPAATPSAASAPASSGSAVATAYGHTFIDYASMFVSCNKMVQYYVMCGYCKICYIQIVKVRKKCLQVIFLHYSCIYNIASATVNESDGYEI
jgi:hypothetical protein